MEEVIYVESYEIDKKCIIHGIIDVALHSNGLFRFDPFSYTAGDCLFDTFQVLLHFGYSSIELSNGLIDYFLTCFKNGNVEALQSYEYKLESDYLRQLHGIMMWLCIFQRCGCLHLQFFLHIRGDFGDIHFAFSGCLTG
jgi:hypothetical protein